MQVNPAPPVASADLHHFEGPVVERPPEQLVGRPEPATPVEKPPKTANAFPEPNRVSVSVDQTREFVYRFVDAKTGEVVSQVPSQAVLKVVREIQSQLQAEENRKTAVINVRG